MWNPLPPWALSTPHMNTKWVSMTIRAQSELCATLAEDCGTSVNQSEGTINTLLIDLGQIINQSDLDEINSELQSSYKQVVDELYAQNILARNNTFKARRAAKEPCCGPANRRAPSPDKCTKHSTRTEGPDRSWDRISTGTMANVDHPRTGGTGQPLPSKIFLDSSWSSPRSSKA